MSTPRISVVMPVYNRDWCVAEAIESVLATGEPNLELLVIDDGSTDNTNVILSRLAQKYPKSIRLLQHPDSNNHGIAHSRNLGLKMSLGEYIAFLDSDDLYLPERFKQAIPWLEKNLEYAGCIEPYSIQCIGNEKQPVMERHLTAYPSENSSWLKAMLHHSVYWTMPVATFRRTALMNYGIFDVRLRVAEEVALWLKLVAVDKMGCTQSEKPVAYVRRHAQHSWDLIDHVSSRAAFLHVLLDTTRWALPRNDVSPNAKAILRERLRTYLIEILSEPGLPLNLRLKGWIQGVSTDLGILHDRRVIANLLHIPFRI